MSVEPGNSAGASAAERDDDYVTDVAYARTFVTELAPSALALVAAMNGVAAPSTETFDYCEVGCGNGDTLAILAAANPNGRFVGVDLNAEHVAFAEGLAARGGLDNLRFVAHDFADLAPDALPPLDFLAMHGVASWVGPAKRQALLRLASERLKPGGLMYVSYNALPGWAALEPLRRLMIEHGARVGGSTLDRARAGVELAQRLCDAKSVYFTSHPTAQSMLALMRKAGLRYVAHEYFHAHWQPMYFADLAREMAATGLAYVGQSPLSLNVRALALPPALKELAQSCGDDRLAIESLKDFALNEFFRYDVFAKGGAPRSAAATREFFDGTPFGALVATTQLQRELRLPHYTLQFTGPLFDALIAALARGAATARELAETPELAEFGVHRIGDALQNLTLGGQVSPMRARRPAPLPSGGARGRRHRVPLAHNRAVLEQELSREHPLVLAAPATGNGVPLSMLEAVCVRLLTEVDEGDVERRAAWLHALVARAPLRFVSGAERSNDPAALVAAISRELDRFCEVRLAKLVELGVIEPVA
jgi:SAM-dependent methyltransferase